MIISEADKYSAFSNPVSGGSTGGGGRSNPLHTPLPFLNIPWK